MFYKEKQDAIPNKDGNKLWRPEIVRMGKTINVKALSKLISTATTVTQADIAAVLYSLPQFMNIYLKEGYSIRLDGLGIFTVYGRTKGNGVKTKDEVRPTQFGSLVLKFTPEYSIETGGTRTRALLNGVEFKHIKTLASTTTEGSDNSGGNNGGDDDIVDPGA